VERDILNVAERFDLKQCVAEVLGRLVNEYDPYWSNVEERTWRAGERLRRKKGLALLNDLIVRMATGDDSDPTLRRMLAEVLMRCELQLVPKHFSRKRPRNSARDGVIIHFIREELRNHPGRQLKAIYADAERRFRLGRSQIRHIWALANGPV
jgi:hypothetical protein